MSLASKLTSVKRVVKELNKWPDDSHKIYSALSLRNKLIEKYSKVLNGASAANLPPSHLIDNEATAANMLQRNLNHDTYPLSDRIFHPTGNPRYYDKIVAESNKGAKKAGFFKSIRDTAFGWFKK